jgi:hypothetical protein
MTCIFTTLLGGCGEDCGRLIQVIIEDRTEPLLYRGNVHILSLGIVHNLLRRMDEHVILSQSEPFT